MRIKHLLFLCFLSLTTACTTAQKSTVEFLSAHRGNTGHRGIVPKEERMEPLKGKDYFVVTLKAKKKCTLEIVSLTVKDYGGQVLLKPVFEGGKSKMPLKANEECSIRVEKEDKTTVAKPKIAKDGSLVLKINGKLTTLPIEKFEMIMPQ